MASEADDTIYVDIVARLDESKARDSVGKLKDQFKDAGHAINETMRETVWEPFRDAAKDYGRQVGEELKRGDVKEAMKDIGQTVGNTTNLIANMGDAFGVSLEGLRSGGSDLENLFHDIGTSADAIKDNLGGALDAFKNKDVATGLDGLAKALKEMGGPDATTVTGTIKTLADKTGDMATNLKNAGQEMHGFTESGEKGLPGLLNKLDHGAGAISAIVGTLIEAKEIFDYIGGGKNAWPTMPAPLPDHPFVGPQLPPTPVITVPGLPAPIGGVPGTPGLSTPPSVYPRGVTPPGGSGWPLPDLAPRDDGGGGDSDRGSGGAGFGGSGYGGGGGFGGLNLSTIPVAAQKYANDCIDASARIILSHSGVNMTEEQLESVIAPGGTIASQAAGMNRLDPAGGFMPMQGSGGSPEAMFAAIKASIDNGTGSILNVAPGSSLAGRTFGEGHFIAATGYNPDGTINLSDTAGGTRYSVSPADAYQATRGRGIVAGTGMGPAPYGAGGPMAVGAGFGQGGASGMPTGTQNNPVFVAPASSAGGAGGVGGVGGDAGGGMGSGPGGGGLGSILGGHFGGYGGSSLGSIAGNAITGYGQQFNPFRILSNAMGGRGGGGGTGLTGLLGGLAGGHGGMFGAGYGTPGGPGGGGPLPGLPSGVGAPGGLGGAHGALAGFGTPKPGEAQSQTQMGQGSGFGLTGGGLIGFAEQAPMAALQAGASGGGDMGIGAGAGAGAALAMAAINDFAVPEFDQAAKSVGQLASSAIAGIGETLSPSGESSSGWPMKLLGGLMGAQFSLPNVAGATAPPVQPKSGGGTGSGSGMDGDGFHVGGQADMAGNNGGQGTPTSGSGNGGTQQHFHGPVTVNNGPAVPAGAATTPGGAPSVHMAMQPA